MTYKMAATYCTIPKVVRTELFTMGVCIMLRMYQLNIKTRSQQILVRVFIWWPSLHASALMSGHLQVISYNTVYTVYIYTCIYIYSIYIIQYTVYYIVTIIYKQIRWVSITLRGQKPQRTDTTTTDWTRSPTLKNKHTIGVKTKSQSWSWS
jgi:hypothetical protein